MDITQYTPKNTRVICLDECERILGINGCFLRTGMIDRYSDGLLFIRFGLASGIACQDWSGWKTYE